MSDLQATIARWERIIADGHVPLVCDHCGRCHADDQAALEESCDKEGCGRFKQRMNYATIADIVADVATLIHFVAAKQEPGA